MAVGVFDGNGVVGTRLGSLCVGAAGVLNKIGVDVISISGGGVILRSVGEGITPVIIKITTTMIRKVPRLLPRSPIAFSRALSFALPLDGWEQVAGGSRGDRDSWQFYLDLGIGACISKPGFQGSRLQGSPGVSRQRMSKVMIKHQQDVVTNR